MKKILVILAVFLMLHQNSFGQETENAEKKERKVTIQTNPLLFFSDIFADESETLFLMDLEGQFKITNLSNISLTLSFLVNNRTYEDFEEGTSYGENMFQIGFKPMYILRPFETGLSGFFLGFYPHVGFLYVGTKSEDSFFTELGFGFNIGYKWVFRSGFTMQLGGGIGKTFSVPEQSKEYLSINSDGRITITHTDIYLLDFKLGYSF